MSRLLVLKHQTTEADSSPELRFLLSSCVAEARRIFGEVDVVRWRPGLDPDLPLAGPAIVLGSPNVFIGHQSLEVMLQALERGAGIVLPEPLERFQVEAQAMPDTLRGFEKLERALLQSPPSLPSERSSHLPIALLSARVSADWRGQFSTERILTDGELLAHAARDCDVARAGVYYEFIDYYGETRHDILPLLSAGTKSVLEVGCGRGHTGAMLQQHLGCQVTGVELNPEIAADAATRLSRVIVGNVEELELSERFDAVVATELLEHLTRPEEFLLRMRSLLEPGGRIVLSVPNVGHHSIVEDLVAGRWDYVPMGLLCYTHLRFFTRATLDDWISRLGFASWEIFPQKGGLPARFRRLPEDWEIDSESLQTRGFLVVLKV